MDKLFNPFSLEGKTIVVTGASSGIGQQVAIACSQMGAKVALIGRNKERLEETILQLQGEGHLSISYDLTDMEHQKEVVTDIVTRMGLIDGLVNCAGISTTLPLKMMPPAKVEEFFKTNVFATIELTRQVLNIKNVNKQGASVIFFASVMGCVGENAKSLYSLTKGALISGCRSLAIEYAPKKIRLNVVSPGVVETAINRNQPYLADPEKRKITESLHPLGLGTPDDIANACIYLLSDASRWVTGQNLIVDGGYTIK
jgi:NAD(P)-dependent dehydrogenase (short-subunit alcohol dehydrogenase family)